MDFKTIDGYEKYEVSREGVVREVSTKKELEPKPNKGGYMYVSLNQCKDKCKIKFVHQLVVNTFLGPVEKGYEINHISEDKTDNSLDNLEVVTHKDNVRKYLANHPVANKLASHRAAVSRKKKMLERLSCVADLIIQHFDDYDLLKQVNSKLTECGLGKITYSTLYRYKKELK